MIDISGKRLTNTPMSPQPELSNPSAFDIIRCELWPLAGKAVLDIGCGRGRLRPKLEAQGALWRGLDPSPPGPLADMEIAPAQAMPYADALFDAAIFLNALHHVPAAHMSTALREAARVMGPDGTLIVIEPLASGPYSQVLGVVDDETDIRAAAQQAMDRCACLRETRTYTYERQEAFADFDTFCSVITAVDAQRVPLIEARKEALLAAFETHAVKTEGATILVQPMSVRLFRKENADG